MIQTPLHTDSVAWHDPKTLRAGIVPLHTDSVAWHDPKTLHTDSVAWHDPKAMQTAWRGVGLERERSKASQHTMRAWYGMRCVWYMLLPKSLLEQSCLVTFGPTL